MYTPEIHPHIFSENLKLFESEVLSIKHNLDAIKSYPIVDYAARIGFTPRRIGRYYTLKEHDSVRIDPVKNCFWRNSTGTRGSLIDFVMHFENKDMPDAIQSLGTQMTVAERKPIAPQPRASPSSPPLKLPKPNRNNDRAYAYLRGRGISKLTINRLIADGLLYESADSHRCVFAGKDSDGVTKFACERGTRDSWKGDVTGSDKRFSFHLPAKTKELTAKVRAGTATAEELDEYRQERERINAWQRERYAKKQAALPPKEKRLSLAEIAECRKAGIPLTEEEIERHEAYKERKRKDQERLRERRKANTPPKPKKLMLKDVKEKAKNGEPLNETEQAMLDRYREQRRGYNEKEYDKIRKNPKEKAA